MRYSPPAYLAPKGAVPLERRLRALLAANVPVPCPVYVGLGDPVARSSRHAQVTHAVASLLVAGAADRVPRTNTNPAPILRVLAAASWARTDAMGSDMDAFPADLASPLWHRVAEVTSEPDRLTDVERRVAADLLLRLGYVRRAVRVLGMDGVTVGTHAFARPALAMKEFAVLYWRSHDPVELDALALRGAVDPALPVETRASLATFVAVRHGKLGVESPVMREAAELAIAAVERLDPEDFADNLAKQACYRGLAFVPFVDRDRAGTLDLLDRASRCQAAAVPRTELERLAWDDYAFPLFETLARTNVLFERPAEALKATGELLVISPGDHRAWTARGRALLASGRIEEALGAYREMEALGGLAAASATFHQGWILRQLGRPAEAAAAYRASARIDPTVPALVEQEADPAGRTAGPRAAESA